ncbi:hypothetical protein P170DRAFT_247046 [Aspergillus steynii IBT 23096]|uniref:Uncharacterized protein n=1 Tax=Aspergillus steynii IBT 23096 TaxID=1392250 RepID=A0A2I2FY73_9EURO|nr:uncharacterized protein P170DRAFT_247046 [Aspergillus steynii IBT 23096]PLB45587.1 hypothetical protein P170DRAFT_247046 [Aspergillus steynii IBT 23096]
MRVRSKKNKKGRGSLRCLRNGQLSYAAIRFARENKFALDYLHCACETRRRLWLDFVRPFGNFKYGLVGWLIGWMQVADAVCSVVWFVNRDRSRLWAHEFQLPYPYPMFIYMVRVHAIVQHSVCRSESLECHFLVSSRRGLVWSV